MMATKHASRKTPEWLPPLNTIDGLEEIRGVLKREWANKIKDYFIIWQEGIHKKVWKDIFNLPAPHYSSRN